MPQLHGNQTMILVDDREVVTLRDILPETADLQVLFVAKTPAPTSVEVGHYFQGRQGKMFWNRLKNYGLLKPTTPFEDDSLLAHGFGLTDIAKIPREYGEEPSPAEYAAGSERILELIRQHRPKIVVFVYKKVLDAIMKFGVGVEEQSKYGFNPLVERFFGARVFAFPLPGTPCKSADAASAMQDLVRVFTGMTRTHADYQSEGAAQQANLRSPAMIEIPIPRFGRGTPPAGKLIINKIVTDYTGTLSCGGKLTPGVADRLRKLKGHVEIHVVSSDSFGTAREQLAAIPLEPHLLTTAEHDEEKRQYVTAREPNFIAAFGNGRNDALMLKTVKDAGGLAIAVDNGEGCAVEALQNTNIFVVGIANALDLLLDTTRLKATLRT